MFFDKLNNTTYHKLDIYLKQIAKSKNDSCNNTSDKEYGEYNCIRNSDDMSDTTSDYKLKYSNTEKNLIKRKRQNDQQKTEGSIVYQNYD